MRVRIPPRILPLAAGLAALCACLPELPQRDPYLLKAPPAPKGIREIPHTFALGMISGRAAKSVTMTVFDTGSITTRGEGVSSRKSYQAKIKLAVPAFLIEHSAQGLILFGTGLGAAPERRPGVGLFDVVGFFSTGEYSFRYKQRKSQNLLRRLVSAGRNPAEVKWIILPFWDPGTIGMLDAFPEAKVVIAQSEWDWRKSKETAPPGPLDPGSFAGKVKFELVDPRSAPALGAFENGLDLFKDGSLFLVDLPGRSPGNMGLWVNLDEGPALLTGGAAFVMDNTLDLALPVKGKIDDLADYWRSLHLIRAMSAAVPRLVVFPGNDLTPLKLVRRKDIKAGK